MLIEVCCLVFILALVGGVGLASGLVFRHLAQTPPPWVSVALGSRRSPAVGWVGLPLFWFWLLLMTLTWLYLGRFQGTLIRAPHLELIPGAKGARLLPGYLPGLYG